MPRGPRVGFLGAGLIARYHAHSLQSSGAPVTWASVYDPAIERAAALAATTGAAVAGSEAEVIDGADAVYVCTWTSEHRRLVEAVAEAGKAVFCEKPLAVDLAQARAVTEAVQAAGVVNQVGLVLRASPALNALAERVADPASGRVMAVVLRDDQYLPTQGMYQSDWRGDRNRAGAGALLEHSIHDVDVLEWLGGPLVWGSARTASFHGLPGIEDVVAATAVYAGGGTASLTSVWHDVLARPSLRYIEVICERGWFALDSDWRGPLRWVTDAGDGTLHPPVSAGYGGSGNPDSTFIQAVREGRPAFPDFSVALRAHVVVEGLYRSAASGGAPTEW
ncbi:MAG TPA: Gfo/Idh/MocA family oxidoreductase [Acidimicrobiales bacterium]|nr:Gfo/Idh/MocA family oxidoreductase [Acidimicrobiales bacterium]